MIRQSHSVVRSDNQQAAYSSVFLGLLGHVLPAWLDRTCSYMITKKVMQFGRKAAS